jgi:hypothetical protein
MEERAINEASDFAFQRVQEKVISKFAMYLQTDIRAHASHV